MSSLKIQPIRALSTLNEAGARGVQEDFALVVRDKGIFAIADGFGGAEAGQGAARTACEAVRAFLEKEAGDQDATLPFVLRSYFSLAGNVLFNALIHANRKVLRFNRGKNVHEKGGASVLAAYMDGDLLALANVGACTAWLIRDGRTARLVAPRTYAQLCDPWGAVASPEERDSLQVPLMAVGVCEDLEPEIVECRVRAGDWLVLCTDGLDPSRVERLAELQSRSAPRGKVAEAVLDEASLILRGEGDGPDNLSVSLAIF